MMILSIIKYIAAIVAIVGVMAFILLVPIVGIGSYFIIKSSKEKDQHKKRSHRKTGIWIIAMPFILVFISLAAYVASVLLENLIKVK